MSLSDIIRHKALELGFDLVGIAPAGESPHAASFQSWLAQGYHAGMGWMERAPERRLDSRRALERAQSVVALGCTYFVQDPPADLWANPLRGRVARYAWGRDYHDVLKARLDTLGRFIRSEADGELRYKVYVDSGPLLEHDIAVKAGLGFMGRNSLLIAPGVGSYVFLAEIVIDRELDYDTPLEVDEAHACGHCQRCLAHCPTGAFPEPYVVDSNRCISYLTIEHKGSIPEELRPLMGNWIFGCDVCQSVCPWVKRYSKPKSEFFLQYDPDFAAPDLIALLQLDAVQFKARFESTPLMRSKRAGLLRNACVALGNGGSEDALPALEQAAKDDEELIREHAEWAMRRILDTGC